MCFEVNSAIEGGYVPWMAGIVTLKGKYVL